MLGLLLALPPAAILPLSLSIFVLAWVGQFIGHQLEGKKPSFLDDLRFLLIGPLFVLRVLYAACIGLIERRQGRRHERSAKCLSLS